MHHVIFFIYLCTVAKNQIHDQLTRNQKRGAFAKGSLSFAKKRCNMQPLKVDRTKLITAAAYARKLGVSHTAVQKMMASGKVNVVNIIGGKLILLP